MKKIKILSYILCFTLISSSIWAQRKKTSTKRVGRTPVIKRKIPKANKGMASIIFFYLGDSYITNFFQETVPLHKAFDGYKYKVLLKHKTKFAGIKLSKKAIKKANIMAKPTKYNLAKYIIKLTKMGYMIDIWIFSHGNKTKFRVSKGKYGQNDYFYVEDFDKLLSPKKTGYIRLPIRMVYQINCYGAYLNKHWLRIGAKVSTGARFVNFFPQEFRKFVKYWNKGIHFSKAVKTARTKTMIRFTQTFIRMKAVLTQKEWGKLPFGRTGKYILKNNKYAKKYFTKKWIRKSEWQNGKSGAANMLISSYKIVQGQGKLTKKSKPSWKTSK